MMHTLLLFLAVVLFLLLYIQCVANEVYNATPAIYYHSTKVGRCIYKFIAHY